MNIITMPSAARQEYEFVNQPVLLRQWNRCLLFPCIVLCHVATRATVAYPCFERWYLRLNEAEEMAPSTLRKRAAAVCQFLNHVLWRTNCSMIHEISLNEVRDFLVEYKTRSTGEERSKEGWNEGITYVYDFLAFYYSCNKDIFAFRYCTKQLITTQRVSKSFNGQSRSVVVKQYNHLFVKAPKQLTRKNRLLLHEYMDMIIFECEKYAPDIALGVALQAYAGIREGGVVNLTFGRFSLISGGFGLINEVSLDLTVPAPFANRGKSEFGSIKKYRMQKVYPDFVPEILRLYQAHTARMESLGCAVTGDASLFVDYQGNPMSVKTYSERVEAIFKKHFLPDLERMSHEMNRWEVDAPYIEAFERDYPGAHAFRHWFTMYLLTRTNLKREQIAKWRGDSSDQSMNNYVHANAEMLDAFNAASNAFQRNVLERILT